MIKTEDTVKVNAIIAPTQTPVLTPSETEADGDEVDVLIERGVELVEVVVVRFPVSRDCFTAEKTSLGNPVESKKLLKVVSEDERVKDEGKVLTG
jgi:hypothetical protein